MKWGQNYSVDDILEAFKVGSLYFNSTIMYYIMWIINKLFKWYISVKLS